MNTFADYVFNYLLIGLEIYQFLLLLYVIASWFGGIPQNAIGYFLRDLIYPVLRFVQKIPHTIGPVDISAIYAFILIGFIKMLLISLFANF